MKGSSPSRSKMKMRCSIEREMPDAPDGFGQTAGGWKEIAGWVPCHCWAGSSGGRHTVMGDSRTVQTDMPGMIVPLGTDVKRTDRIAVVTDKSAKVLFPTMGIDAVLNRLTHLELRLREIT